MRLAALVLAGLAALTTPLALRRDSDARQGADTAVERPPVLELPPIATQLDEALLKTKRLLFEVS